MFSVGIGIGMFNAISTLIEQMVEPSGYTEDDAGIFGALLIGGGLIGAGIVGPIMDMTHAYRRLLKLGISFVVLSTIFVFCVMKPGQKELLVNQNIDIFYFYFYLFIYI
jgi:hypothetical protein